MQLIHNKALECGKLVLLETTTTIVDKVDKAL
jgi:hypothetical protein